MVVHRGFYLQSLLWRIRAFLRELQTCTKFFWLSLGLLEDLRWLSMMGPKSCFRSRKVPTWTDWPQILF